MRAGFISFAYVRLHASPSAEMLEDFARVCAGEAVPHPATGMDGLGALEIALAAYEAARRGTPVPVGSDRSTV